MEDETERMRAELLKKEKELIELRQKELDLQIAKFKNQGLEQVNFHNNFPVSCHFLSSDTKYINEINILLANVLLSRVTRIIKMCQNIIKFCQNYKSISHVMISFLRCRRCKI